MTDGDAPASQSVTQGDRTPDPILLAIEKKRQQLQDMATSDETITAERRRSLERQLKDLKEWARHDAELAQIMQERQELNQS